MSSGNKNGSKSVTAMQTFRCQCGLLNAATNIVCKNCGASRVSATVSNDRKTTGAPKTVLTRGTKQTMLFIDTQPTKKAVAVRPKVPVVARNNVLAHLPVPVSVVSRPTVPVPVVSRPTVPVPVRVDLMVTNRVDFFNLPCCLTCCAENNSFANETCVCGKSLRGMYFRLTNDTMKDTGRSATLCMTCPSCLKYHDGNNMQPCDCGVGSLCVADSVWTEVFATRFNALRNIYEGHIDGDIKQARLAEKIMTDTLSDGTKRASAPVAPRSDAKAPPASSGEWDCGDCTFSNSRADSKCAMCDGTKPRVHASIVPSAPPASIVPSAPPASIVPSAPSSPTPAFRRCDHCWHRCAQTDAFCTHCFLDFV